MATIPKGPSTKDKLATIVSGFDEFDLEMKRGTRVSICLRYLSLSKLYLQQRREKDEFKITELKNEMARLDAELVVEVKRRQEMNKSTQMVGKAVVFYQYW